MREQAFDNVASLVTALATNRQRRWIEPTFVDMLLRAVDTSDS